MADGVGSKTELLNLLGDVKAQVQDKLGAVNFPMPQFILLGKQSVGKSRLIETLAGEAFNFISGTLGSRRPTVLEFRTMPTAKSSKWYVRDVQTNTWVDKAVSDVMTWVGERHNELGANVSHDPIYVKIESPTAVDMTIVDLPGFRDFSLDDEKKALAEKILQLVTKFMRDTNNVMLCVEQAADASNMSSLQRCKEYDPELKRTVLIRNKLDKFYNDLTDENVNKWVTGYGDLPKDLTSFALTLPFWKDGADCPKPFHELIDEKDRGDLQAMASRNLSPNHLNKIGFKHFQAFMEKKMEEMFADAIQPVLDKLRQFKSNHEKDLGYLQTEYKDTDPSSVLQTTKTCGSDFAKSLDLLMQGQLGLERSMVTLEEELNAFHEHHKNNDHFLRLPAPEFAALSDYIDYLQNEAGIASASVKLNGGAQFRRLMTEVEIFLRFSEIAVNMKKRDVIQARGVSMSQMTWRDAVVKLLGNEAHVPMQQRVRYVGERIRWFFVTQKESVLECMEGTPGSNYADSLPRSAKIIQNNQITKHLLFEAWDNAVMRQMNGFLDLFDNMLISTFSNPWVFLKTASVDDSALPDVKLPDVKSGSKMTKEGMEDIMKERIPKEIQSRAGTETLLAAWFNTIPTEEHQIDDAVDKVEMLVLKTYSYIRSQLCDQVEIFSESFFKVPMLRKLSDDMHAIELSEDNIAKYRYRREELTKDMEEKTSQLKEIDDCIRKIDDFKYAHEANPF